MSDTKIVIPVTEFGGEDRFTFSEGDIDILVVKTEGKFYALEDRCTHRDIPLSDGEVEDGQITCFAHGAKFCLKTGEAKCLPATEPINLLTLKTGTVDESGNFHESHSEITHLEILLP